MFKKGWERVRLGDICNTNVKSISKSYEHKSIRYIDISSVGTGMFHGFTDYEIAKAPSRARRLLSDGDTILSTVRPNRKSFFYIKEPKDNWVASTGFCVISPNSNIDSRFIYYIVTTQYCTEYLTNNAKGSAYPAVDTKTIERYEFLLPPLPTQKRIASILSNYDDLIENNTRRIKILEEQAQALYRQWFVEFKFPGYEEVEMIESGSEFGEIPEGWKERKLVDACHLLMGQSPKSEFYNEEGNGIPFHQGVTNFGTIFPSDTKYCTYNKGRIANTGDILLSVRAPVGRINIANNTLMIGRGLCSIRDKNGYQSFILQQLKSIFYAEDIMGGGSIFQSVTKGDMQNIKLIYPNKEIIIKFEKIASQIDKEIVNISKQNINLKKQRDTLLPKLVSGEILVD